MKDHVFQNYSLDHFKYNLKKIKWIWANAYNVTNLLNYFIKSVF